MCTRSAASMAERKGPMRCTRAYSATPAAQAQATPADTRDYLSVHVFVNVKEGTEEDFADASVLNAINSADEPGVARFDVIQNSEDPLKFVLVEVYKDGDAPAAHKETEHYAAWRDRVADMMATPRSAVKMKVVFPPKPTNWDYPSVLDDDDESEEQEVFCHHVTARVMDGLQESFLDATILNARTSMVEDGVARFDILRHIDDEQQFMLVRVFKSLEAKERQENSMHEKQWKEDIAQYLEGPLGQADFSNIFPPEIGRWEYRSKLAA
eukprot:CAMPEP_0170182112 /NCGR_PEP_ID=MMETSP0040_2-20121228/26972_1 /TAXON_ID=641309 /ORGANISM="Lotharella oceanica, Strain CCMP622" /LENGTH=267 /DNA_ID=CAMNT_0010427417 /DNA_START=1 /DNA_END=804 /DNA_ORIENTATION=+